MELSRKARLVQGELDRLPQSFAENPQAMLLGLCSEFVSEIGKYTHGNSTHPAFFQDINSAFWSLAKEISDTRPQFEISCSGKMKSEGGVISEEISLPGSSGYPEPKEACLQCTTFYTYLTISHVSRFGKTSNSSEVNSRITRHYSVYSARTFHRFIRFYLGSHLLGVFS